MDAFELRDLLAQHGPLGNRYYEFLRRESMSLGIYKLAAASQDPQQPHGEDEVYYVIGGRARVKVGSEDRAVEAGSVVFVAAGVDHRFYAIDEDLILLVFFAPPEGSVSP